MLATFTVLPMGKGESISPIIAKVVKAVDASGLDYKLTSMGTMIEGDWDEVMAVIKKCHKLVGRLTPRVYTTIAIDDRKGAKHRLEGKVESVKKKVKFEVKT
jgi:uncharacterized protein (TIGR00106 family)